MKKLSIIIIVKNEPNLKNLLDKLVLIKAFLNLEIIVVDSSKKDYYKRETVFKRVKWLRYKNITNKQYTYAEQRNLGIKNASGDIIVFIDADCIPDKKWLKTLINPIIKGDEYICAGNVKSVRPYPIRWDAYYQRFEDKKYINMIVGANAAISKSVFEKVGSFSEDIKIGGNEDYDFSIKIKSSGYKIRYIKNAIVYHDWGDTAENVHRVLNYGQRRFYSYLQHIKNIKEFNIIIVLYAIYLLFLPISYYFPYYLLFVLIPILKNYYVYKSITSAFDEVFYNFIESAGFIKGAITYCLQS